MQGSDSEDENCQIADEPNVDQTQEQPNADQPQE